MVQCCGGARNLESGCRCADMLCVFLAMIDRRHLRVYSSKSCSITLAQIHLLQCGQGKRSSYDEEFLMAIHGCSQNKKKTALIADCRPKTYAIANMAKGKG